jgi:4'-phosphopantetheinyl transferase
VPHGDGWLLPQERATLALLGFSKRRADWRRGRWAAKQAVAAVLGVDAADVSVQAAVDGAPEAFVHGRPAPVTVSISHCAGRAACLVTAPAAAGGCDLELVETRAPVFIADWFTESERRLVASAASGARDLVVTLVWSAKESALKALRCGLRRDTRSVEIIQLVLQEGGWCRLQVRDAESGETLHGWWSRVGDLVLTVVTGQSSPAPTGLRQPTDDRHGHS